MFTDDRLGVVDDLNSFSVQLDAYQGLALLLLPRRPSPIRARLSAC